MTTREEIRNWLEAGKANGCTHVIVATDTFDWSDYPIYVGPNDDVRKMVDEHNGKNMQKVMEVYNLSMDIEEQLKPGTRVRNY